MANTGKVTNYKPPNPKKIYSKEDLDPDVRFLDPPSTAAQNYIGDIARHLSVNEPIKHTEYPNWKYEYVGKLGDGSASKLYKGKRRSDNKEVVIKRIPKYEEWRNELNILKTLRGSSERIINLLDFYESDRCAYVITDLYKGFDLFDHIDLNVPYTESQAKTLIKEMILCIKECHDREIAHLDIKCENYMVTKMPHDLCDLEIILIDFGHAEKIEHDTMKRGHSNYGTCFYLCPEGYQKLYSMKSDTWSLGICTHLLLTGDYPYRGDDDEYADNVCNGKIEISRKISPVALDFLRISLDYNPRTRATIYQLLEHPFLRN